MFYKIKILQKGGFLFATDPDSMRTIHDLTATFKLLNEKFQEAEGYTLEVYLYPIKFSRDAFQHLVHKIEKANLTTLDIILMFNR